MKTDATELVLTVKAMDGKSLDLELDAAVARLREQAVLDGTRGIVVTRYTPETFTVALSDDVPFGKTLELDLSDSTRN
jgi:hypothetical protein